MYMHYYIFLFVHMCAPVLDQPIVFAASVTSVPDGQNSVIESCLTAEPAVVDAGPEIDTS